MTFVRTDRWLPKQPDIDADEARAELARRFLAAFGPASTRDFVKWSGMKAPEAKSAFAALGGDIVELSVEGGRGWILSRGRSALCKKRPEE